MDPAAPGSPLSRQGLWQPAPRSQHGRRHHHCGLPVAQCASLWGRPGQQWELCSREVLGDMGSAPGSPQPLASLCRGLRVPNYKMRVAAKTAWGPFQQAISPAATQSLSFTFCFSGGRGAAKSFKGVVPVALPLGPQLTALPHGLATVCRTRIHAEHAQLRPQGEDSSSQSVSSVQFSRSVVSNSLRPHGLQHTRPPCPSPTPGVYSNSCLLSQ